MVYEIQPSTPGFYVRAQQDPDKNENSKGSYQIASTFDMHININEMVDVNQDGPSLIIRGTLKHIYKLFMSSVDPCILI